MSKRSTRVVLVLFLCLAVRSAFFLAAQPWKPHREANVVLHSDSRDYHLLASTLLEARRFASTPSGAPETLRTPGYPVFIAAIYGLGGRPWQVLVAQLFLDTLTCALFFVALARLFDDRLAIVAAALYALDPILILYTSTMMSETLFVFCLVLCLLFLSRILAPAARRQANWPAAACAGLALGAATLVRPIAQYLPLVVVAVLAVLDRRLPNSAFKNSAALLVAFVLVVAPWSARNLRHFGDVSLSTSAAYNLLVLNVGTLQGTRLGVDPVSLQAPLLEEANSLAIRDGFDPATMNPFTLARYQKNLAREYMQKDLGGFVRCYARGIANSLMNIASWEVARVLGWDLPLVQIKTGAGLRDMLRAYVRSKGIRGILIAVASVPLLLLAYAGTACGLFVAWRRYKWAALSLSLLLALYFLALTGAAGLARFKIPSIPFYLPFAAAGLLYFWTRARGKLARV